MEKVVVVTEDAVLESWCETELQGCFSVSSVSFRECRNFLSFIKCVDIILVDYSFEQEKAVLELYGLFCKENLDKKRFVLLYDSFSHEVSKLECLYSKAECFNLISPVYLLRSFLGADILDKSEVCAAEDVSMAQFEERLKIVASNDECVLLLGECGSGKSWAAKKIHEYSKRSKERFLSVNVSEFNPNLIEGNLFGVNAGAYTGAVAQKGWFESADKGTLLLDEIGELPVSLQPKLLSVIENHKYNRLGSTKDYSFDEKLIFATNRNLEECIGNKTFRSDLFYRISCLTLCVPPLRNRKCDIPSLAKEFSLTHKKFLSETAIDKLLNYSWPGNIRELRNVIMRACFFSKRDILNAEDISFSYYG